MKILSDPALIFSPKLAILCDRLGCSIEVGFTRLHQLWGWAIHHRDNGSLAGLNDQLEAASGAGPRWAMRPDSRFAMDQKHVDL